MTRPAERPRGGFWRTEIVRAVLSGHSILGIAFAAVIYLICLTGTAAVFMRDFQRWEQPTAPRMSEISDAAVARAIAEMGSRAGPDKSFYVSLPNSDFPRLLISSGGDDDDESWFADGTGELAVRQRAPWTQFLVELHTRLHLPQAWGRFVVGLAGAALLSSLISGILAHPRVFRDAFHLRLGGSRRLEQADLHNRLGVWPLPFHIIVSLTGALLGLSTVIVGVLALLLFRGDSEKVYALLAPPPARADPRPAPVPDVAQWIASARSRSPGAEPRQIEISHWGRRDMRMEVSLSRPQLIAQQDSVTFDAAGKVVFEKHPSGLTVGERILGSLGQLHFGWFGGLPIRIAYGLLGLALCVVTSSGISVWLARRRDKGRAAPGWERLWVAISWGQPAALAATIPIALLLRDNVMSDGLAALWVSLTLLLALGASALVTMPAGRLAAYFRLACCGLLLLGAAIQLVISLQQPADPGGYLIDGIFVIIACLIGASHARAISVRRTAATRV